MLGIEVWTLNNRYHMGDVLFTKGRFAIDSYCTMLLLIFAVTYVFFCILTCIYHQSTKIIPFETR